MIGRNGGFDLDGLRQLENSAIPADLAAAEVALLCVTPRFGPGADGPDMLTADSKDIGKAFLLELNAPERSCSHVSSGACYHSCIQNLWSCSLSKCV